jgi:integrase/recombinase XerD
MINPMDPKKDPDRRCLKVEQWPEPDRLAWGAVLTPGNLLDPGGLGAAWAPHTRHTIARCYGGWLTWLVRSQLLDPTVEPADRVTPERVVRYVDDLRRRNGAYTVPSRVRELCNAIQAMAPARDWRWLHKIVRRLRRSAQPKRKKAALIVPAKHLWDYGLELMEAADADTRGSDLARAAQYRDGLIIALLAARPIRRRNLASIEIGQHLVRRGDGYWICFPDTKTGAVYERRLPLALVPYVEGYLTRYRPVLVQYARPRKRRLFHEAGDRLWISNVGSAMSEGAIYGRVTKLTAVRFGHKINLHLFRDVVATSIAVEQSAHVQITPSLLGHATLATSEKHYNHARSLEATRQYQKHVLALRHRGRDGNAGPPESRRNGEA